MKKHNFNKNFFKTWSKDMAYVLGFWFADGYITMNHKTNTSKTFGIVQSTKDKYILENIKSKIEFTGDVKEEKTSVYPKSTLKIYSKEIYDDIVSLGGMERKSSIVLMPKIPQAWFKYFLLGFFDGDGCVSIDKRNVLKLTFTGGLEFLSSIKEEIIRNKLLNDDTGYGCIYHLNTKNSKTYNLEFATLASYKILSWLYSGIEEEDLFLKRKYEKFNTFKFSKKSKNKVKYTVEDEKGNINFIHNLSKFLSENHIPESSFRKYLKKNKRYNGMLFSRFET